MKLLSVAALIFAALYSAEVVAQDRSFKKSSDAELNAIMDDPSQPWVEKACDLGVPIAAELRRRHPDVSLHMWQHLHAQINCAGQRDNFTEGKRLSVELEHLYPDEPYYTGLGFYFETQLKDADAILQRFKTGDIATLSELRHFWQGVAVVPAAEFNALALNWHDQNRLPLLPSDVREGIATRAVRGAIEADRHDLVPGLLSYIQNPQNYLVMLTSRDLSAVWDILEERAGPNLAIVASQYADWAVAEMIANRADAKLANTATNALLMAGRFEEVVSLVNERRSQIGLTLEMSETEGWLGNDLATAYDANGEPEKADLVFDELASLAPEDHPWVVNFAINRSTRLVKQQRWEEGLTAAAVAREIAEKHGSLYAKSIIASFNSCAYAALGKAADAASEAKFLDQDDILADFRALAKMCMGDRQGAAAELASSLRENRSVNRIAEILRGPDFEVIPDPSLLPQPRDLLAESPELLEEMNKHVRLLPDHFRPLSQMKSVNWLKPRAATATAGERIN